MLLVDLNKNKVTIIKDKGGRPKKDSTFPPRKDLSIKLSVPAYNAIKARHDFEEEIRSELLEDQEGGKSDKRRNRSKHGD